MLTWQVSLHSFTLSQSASGVPLEASDSEKQIRLQRVSKGRQWCTAAYHHLCNENSRVVFQGTVDGIGSELIGMCG